MLEQQAQSKATMLVTRPRSAASSSADVALIRRCAAAASACGPVSPPIRAYPLVGRDVRLTAKERKGLVETKFAEEIIACARALGNLRLIELDHLALLHGGDFNAREDVALTMRVINHIAQETGASVLVLAHTPKSANQQETSDASMVAGSTAFVDQARAAWVMTTMRDNEANAFGVSAGSGSTMCHSRSRRTTTGRPATRVLVQTGAVR